MHKYDKARNGEDGVLLVNKANLNRAKGNLQNFPVLQKVRTKRGTIISRTFSFAKLNP